MKNNLLMENQLLSLKSRLLFKKICCSKLTTSLVNFSLKFQMLIFQICQSVLLKKMRRSFCTAKASLIFSTKISVYNVVKS